MLDLNFLMEFKRATEERWSQQPINPEISGFQFQPGTRWNPGLSEDKIADYENALRVQFPYDFRGFLEVMNGTDLPTLNVYAGRGEAPRTSVGVYSFPRDLEFVKRRIAGLRDNRREIARDLQEQGFDLAATDELVPIYSHRYIVCTSDRARSVVLSIMVDSIDAIVYGNSLQEYLEREFLGSQ